jgi:hypothetical protein
MSIFGLCIVILVVASVATAVATKVYFQLAMFWASVFAIVVSVVGLILIAKDPSPDIPGVILVAAGLFAICGLIAIGVFARNKRA